MTDKEVKDINKDLISRTLTQIHHFLLLHYEEKDANKLVELHEMTISLRFLKTPFLEKRLKGTNCVV